MVVVVVAIVVVIMVVVGVLVVVGVVVMIEVGAVITVAGIVETEPKVCSNEWQWGVLTLQSVLQSYPLTQESFMSCVFSEIVLADFTSRTLIYNDGSVDIVPAKIGARDGNC
jgi:hypothetical protein